MKIFSKAKEEVNERLKKRYPMLTNIIDERYADTNFHIEKHDEATNTTTYLTLPEYEYELEMLLAWTMVSIETEEEAVEDDMVFFGSSL